MLRLAAAMPRSRRREVPENTAKGLVTAHIAVPKFFPGALRRLGRSLVIRIRRRLNHRLRVGDQQPGRMANGLTRDRLAGLSPDALGWDNNGRVRGWKICESCDAGLGLSYLLNHC